MATHPLRIRLFRRLYAAQVVALLGSGLLTVALGLLAYDIAGDDAGAVLGTALAIKMVAYVFVAPMTAAATSRLPPRSVLITTDIMRAAVALSLPFVESIWQIYLLVFALQAASATFTPAYQAVIASALEDERTYTGALSLSRLAYDLESLASPVLAATLLTVVDYPTLFLGTVAGFLSSATAISSVRVPHTPRARRRSRFRDRTLGGFRVMWPSSELRALLALNVVVAAATALVVVNTVVYVRTLLGGQDSGLALALACFGGGSMLVALTLPRLLTAISDRSVMLIGAAACVGALSATTVFIAAVRPGAFGWVSLCTLWAITGAGTSMINTPSARLLRRNSTVENRTDVFTAQFSLSHAAFLLTYPVAGWVGATLNQAVAALLLTALATLATLAAVTMWPRHGREFHGTAPRAPIVAVAGQPRP
ncbi:major facilitator transporter [Mycolicibacterium conceptionense]|uniref:Major facilitator transporter n=3 Tax=Mycolicibacterium TaxID=1866885 RepID=A0ABR5FS88_9MYCO|nr:MULTISPECIES: MFS transporter [Mycolicibacterium]KLI07474.1 major facilitator transporter [Mycolicibacterium senegalense]KLO50807.1 major facilitator transporter [Mycolicibacterium senegalense]KMV15861.1 major facilitator transporter [Mycolicibacterium conceptionense]